MEVEGGLSGEIQKRFVCQGDSQVRMEDRDGKRILSGYGIVFHDAANPATEYRMADDWFERIAPESVDETLADSTRDVTSTFNHNANAMLGRQSSNTLKLFKDSIGVRYEVELPNTTAANDLAELVKRGDVKGSSFTFRERDYKQDRSDPKHKVWTVKRMDLYEIGPVTDPAYKATTTGFRMSEDRVSKIAEIETQERTNQARAARRARAAQIIEETISQRR